MLCSKKTFVILITISAIKTLHNSQSTFEIHTKKLHFYSKIYNQNEHFLLNNIKIGQVPEILLHSVFSNPNFCALEEQRHDHADLDHIDYIGGFHEPMEDDYDEDNAVFNEDNPARSNSSSSSSSESNDGDHTEHHGQDEEQNALNQLNENNVGSAEAAANMVRNLEQLNNDIDLSFRRHQNAIRTMMEENEEEQHDNGQESDDEADIEIEDSTDEEMELETEGDTAEEDEIQNRAQNDATTYDLDIEMLPNESVVEGLRHRGGGLLQVVLF